MKPFTLGVIAIACSLSILACSDTRKTEPISVAIPAVPTTLTNLADKKMEEAATEKKKAIEEGDKLAQLKAEKKQLQAELDKNRADGLAIQQSLAQKDKDIITERVDRAQEKAYWIAGVCGVLGMVAVAASFFITVPLIARIARGAGGVFWAIAILALVFASLVPYLVPIVWTLGALGAVTIVWLWRRDHTGLSQLVSAVEPMKNQIVGGAEHLRDSLTPAVQRNVNSLRVAKGLKPPR